MADARTLRAPTSVTAPPLEGAQVSEKPIDRDPGIRQHLRGLDFETSARGHPQESDRQQRMACILRAARSGSITLKGFANVEWNVVDGTHYVGCNHDLPWRTIGLALGLAGIGAVALPAGLVQYFRARHSRWPVEPEAQESVETETSWSVQPMLLPGGCAVVLGGQMQWGPLWVRLDLRNGRWAMTYANAQTPHYTTRT